MSERAQGLRGRPRRIFLEGRPGVGKTTVARRLADRARAAGIQLAGFVTEELRESGRRVGFAVEAFTGERAILAHVDFSGPPRVGRYGVDLEAFEGVALPALADLGEPELLLLDELGKMELASPRFRAAVSEVFEGTLPIVATVQTRGHAFTDALERLHHVETVRVSERNRDELPDRLARLLLGGSAAR